MPDKRAVNENIVLLDHQLTEIVQIKWSSDETEQLGILQVRREFVEGCWLGAVGQIQRIKFLLVLEAHIIQFRLKQQITDTKITH